ncbi:MAG: hypothetical protein AABX34_06825 [Nanoarchaeota archaeon]
MIKAKACTLFLLAIIGCSMAYALNTSSANYRLFPLVVSTGGDITNSSSYKNYVVSGVISGAIESGAYKNFLGFFHTWLLANGEYCTASSQCEGGFCCSNACRSSACPVAAAVSGGGGGGGEAGGGGGGGGAIAVQKEEIDFSISPSSIKAKLALGDKDEKSLVISNTGSAAITIPLGLETVTKYLSLSENAVSLEPGESKKVTITILAKEVGAFVGEIIAKADGIEKSVPIILEFISKLVLFDIKLDIPAQYAEVEAGGELKAQITLLNLGAPEKVDVFATYFIKDLRSNIVYEEAETFAVEKQLSYQKSFRIHESTLPGNYVAIAEIRYADSFAVSSQLFRVVEKKEKFIVESMARNSMLMLFASLLIVLVISFFTYKLASIRRKGRSKGKKR